ncbi:MAG: DUF169 domain-containing protein [Thermodesulfobacteriota bacterium]|jgi:uncharacterized protein (DUF169 family)
MPDLQNFEQEIKTYIKPTTLPLAIKLLTSEEQIPEKTRRPQRDFKKRFSVCQAVGMSRRMGWTFALGNEDVSCPLSQVSLGFERELPFFKEGNLCEGMYTNTKEAGRRTEAAVPKFKHGQYKYILIGPVARANYEPDIILIYGDSAQVMRLVHAALYEEGGTLTSNFMGRYDCADYTAGVIDSGKCQVILPCNGDRVFGFVQDFEMAFAIPYTQIDKIINGLHGTHKGGVRYPIPFFMNWEATFPPKYVELEKLWKEGKE